MRLKNKVAIISGGSRGMGAFEAALFVQEGAKVIIGDVRDEEGGDLAGQIGSDAVYLHLDVTSESDWAAVVKEATDRFGKLDILVNNAGGGIGESPGHLFQRETQDIVDMISLNLTGPLLCCKAFSPKMAEQGSGKIINIASIAGKHAFPGMGIYCISKSAVMMLTKILGQELAKSNIQVNAIAPGFIKTKFSAALWMDEKANASMIKRIPQKRMADPQEIAGIALYLASDASSFATGETFTVDGGQTI